MRVLHVGNIANNAYQVARILNAAGIESDVLCYDYYHVMGCPEWEDADFRGVPSHLNSDFPDWRGVEVRDFVRPAWFAQGPMGLAADYLQARRRGMALRQRELWKQLEARRPSGASLRRALAGPARKRLAPLRRTAFWIKMWLVEGLGNQELKRAAAGLPALFRQLFPDRQDGLGEREIYPFALKAARLKSLFSEYDVVVGYATDAILPMLARHPCVVAFEHGTLRAIPFENTPLGRLTALAYKTALRAILTNCDNVRAAERLGLQNARYVPHPTNDALIEAADGSEVRRELAAADAPDFIVFHPSRQHWESRRDPGWEKANDVLLKGFARFVKETAARALLVLVRWGRSVEDSQRLLESEGVAHRVRWIQPVPNRRMLEYMRAADVVGDQFWLGTFGGITPKAMACERPVLLRLDPELHGWCFPELPPHIESGTPEDVFCGLRRAYLDPDWRRRVGRESRAWYLKYHSEPVIRARLLETLAEARECARRRSGIG